MRCENPISLSYQAITLIRLPPMTVVNSASTVAVQRHVKVDPDKNSSAFDFHFIYVFISKGSPLTVKVLFCLFFSNRFI